MQWYNEPPKWSHEGDTITFTCGAQTDYWRVTLHNFIQDDGNFYYAPITGDFTATVKVTGAYADLYDQAGIMVRASATVWMKCGIEYLDGVQQASAVVTRDFSDWSVVALADNPASVWVRVQRTGSALEVYYSRDGETFTLIRQSYLTDAPTLDVGLMSCAPKGNGFETVFEGYKVVQG